MKIACVIPARLQSERFPRKMLYPINGKPLVWHTVQRAIEAECFSEVWCFTDSDIIAKALLAYDSFAFKVHVGAKYAKNGTERIARGMYWLESDLILNLQGDEPFFPVDHLRLLASQLHEQPECVHVLVQEYLTKEEAVNPNRVKAAIDTDGRVLDFVRIVDPVAVGPSFGVHLGAYGYGCEFLSRYIETPESQKELDMSHEMLRIQPLPDIRAHWVKEGSSSIDSPEDVDVIISQR